MLKDLSLFRLAKDHTLTAEAIETALTKHAFRPCQATEQSSTGWIPPRGLEHGALIESVAGHWILRVQFESKILPPSVVKLTAEERAAKMQEAGARKLTSSQMRELREQTFFDLLPRAFVKRSAATVWIDATKNLVAIEAASPAKADEIAVLLVSDIPGLSITPLATHRAPQHYMATWLTIFEPPMPFDIDRECELQSTDETKARVSYSRHNLENDEVKRHVLTGKMPTKLALTWHGRVSFLLTDKLQLKKIKLLDAAILSDKAQQEGDDAFDADVAILCGELRTLIPDLTEALGGEAIDLASQ